MDRSKGIFWISVIGIHLIFFFYQLSHQSDFLRDSAEYIQAAENLLEHGSFYCGNFDQPIRIDNYTKRPPVYPAVIAVFGKDGFLMFIQNMLSLLNIYLLIRICRQLYPSIKHFRFLLPFLLLYPAQFIYANAVMTELLFQSLLLGMAVFLMKCWDGDFLTAKTQREERKGRKVSYGKCFPFAINFAALGLIQSPQIRYFTLYTLLLLLAIWTKPVMYLFVFIHLLGGGIWAWKKRSVSMAVLSVLPLMLVLGYMSWNKQRTGYFHFSSIQNLSLLQYSTTYLLISKYGEEEGYRKADEILYRSLAQENYELEQKSLQKDCKDTILTYPFRYAVLHMKGMLNFFLDPGRYDLYSFFQVKNSGGEGMLKAFSENGYTGIWNYLMRQPLKWLMLLGIVLVLNLLKLAGLISFSFNRKLPVHARWIMLGLVLYIAVLTGISGASRFAVPLFPLILIALPSLLRFTPKAISSRMMAY